MPFPSDTAPANVSGRRTAIDPCPRGTALPGRHGWIPCLDGRDCKARGEPVLEEKRAALERLRFAIYKTMARLMRTATGASYDVSDAIDYLVKVIAVSWHPWPLSP